MKKVLLVDDHPLILSALSTMIETMGQGVAVVCAESAAEAHAALLHDPAIELVMLDLTLGDADGFDTLERIRTEHATLPVVVISASDRMADVVRAVDLGAMGYVTKRTSNAELAHALSLVMAGGVYIPAALVGGLAAARAGTAPGAGADEPAVRWGPTQSPAGLTPAGGYAELGLTPRQAEVLALLLRGLPNKLIARELNLSVETVKDHVAAVLRALGVSSRTQAVLAVGRLGHASPDGVDGALRR